MGRLILTFGHLRRRLASSSQYWQPGIESEFLRSTCMNLSAVEWVELQDVIDDRGRLTAIESGLHTPFEIARVFYVHQVSPGVDRGGHAHKDTDQVAVAASGRLKVDVSDGIEIRTYSLDRPDRGLFLPRLVFTRLHDFSSGAVCLVFASTHYDRSKSIRSWTEYLTYRGLARRAGPGE